MNEDERLDVITDPVDVLQNRNRLIGIENCVFSMDQDPRSAARNPDPA